MVMKALRQTAGNGLGKFILFGFLVLAVAGLALADVGGFFSSGAGSNNVIKLGKTTVPITEFDRDVRAQTQAMGISPKEAYKMGYVNAILSGKIRSLLLERYTDEAGLSLSPERIASYTVKLLRPMTSAGQKTDEVLQQILSRQGMSEKQFKHAIEQEMSAKLIADSVASGAASLSTPLTDALYQFQTETRTIEFLKFMDSEMKVGAPSDEDIQQTYNANLGQYLIPATRDITLVTLDDTDLNANTELSATDILNKKLERVEQLEDLYASGASIKDIQAQIPVTVTNIHKLQNNGQIADKNTNIPAFITDNIDKIAEEARALDTGESSMAIELPGAKFTIVAINSIADESYKPLKDVKQAVTKLWTQQNQRIANAARIEKIKATLAEQADTTLKSYAKQQKRKYRTQSLSRNDQDTVFDTTTLQAIFDNKPNTVSTAHIDGGIALYRVTEAKLATITDHDRKKDEYKALAEALKSGLSNDLLTQILEAEHQKSPAKINGKLLERVYGENSTFY